MEESVIKECERAVNELSKFDKSMVYLGPHILDDRLKVFEEKNGFSLPEDFKYLMTIHNGFSLEGTEVLGLDNELRGSSLDNVYDFEISSSRNGMPKYFVPFSPDGRGNHYCLNLDKLEDGICPVVFWQSDCDYQDISDVEECNDNFVSWVHEVMIGWTLEDYNYDGTEKS
ncbi:SMI1/KNR4 family protein [Sphingobacterium sp. PCS056]|uniref:SMI1/KNR4 family protein n=1 Tax=Sphingobacterium sp. PCS056 TaxID=2931400 RepID=UPI00200F3823|nr:SMI1/KNR4 family protein [Sphingobacterium sp. PCS056]UPZ36525.1 SMI1/KNR4 family protein [Sphingobacterium sp. PCS056]